MSKLKKISFLALCALAVSVAFTGLALAVEEDGEGNIVQSKTLTLDGDEIPAPKPKVIIREKIVHQCPRGYGWSAEVGKCLDADGNEFAPAQRQTYTPRPQAAAFDENYVYPEIRARVRMGQCQMTGDQVRCTAKVINASDATNYINLSNVKIYDNLGRTTNAGSVYVSASGTLYVGNAVDLHIDFKYVSPQVDNVNLSFVINSRSLNSSARILSQYIQILAVPLRAASSFK